MTVKKAEELFKIWHAKEPTKHTVVKVELPKTMYMQGRAETIIYRSTKWETKAFDYVHDFDSNPPLYYDGPTDLGAQSTSSLLPRSNPDSKQIPLTLLGHVLSLDMIDADGELVEVTLGRKEPMLLSTIDAKGLVILCDHGPIIIKGGKMTVTKRGIVK